MSLLEGSELYLYKRLFDLRPSLTTALRAQDVPLDRLQIKKTPSVTVINCNQNLRNQNFGLDAQRSRSRLHANLSDRFGDESHSKIPKYGLPRPECVPLQNVCVDCTLLQRQCASCTLMKLMRQHMTGKIDINELRAKLTKICSDEQPEYKKLMIHALEKMFLRKTACSKRARSEGLKTCAHNQLAQVCEECLLKVKNESLPTTSSASCLYKNEHLKNKANFSKIPSTSKDFLLKKTSENVYFSAPKHFNQTQKRTIAGRSAARETSTNKNLESFRSFSVVTDSNKVFEQLTEENLKKNRTQRLQKLPPRNVDAKKLKKLKRGPNDDFCTLKYQKNVENRESKASESDVVRELFSKEKHDRNSKKSTCEDAPAIRIIETASDDAILQIDNTIEREHDELLKKQAVESFENLQKCKNAASKSVPIITIHDSLEIFKRAKEPENTENRAQEENEEKVGDGAETYEIFKADEEKMNNSNSDVEFEIVGGEVQEMIEAKIAESNECSSNSGGNVAGEISVETEGKPEETTESVTEVTDKPLVSGNLSQISYDSLKKDSLWEDIEKDSEMQLLSRSADANFENPENDECTEGIHQERDENAQENTEEIKVYKDTTNPKKKPVKTIKDNNCVLS